MSFSLAVSNCETSPPVACVCCMLNDMNDRYIYPDAAVCSMYSGEQSAAGHCLYNSTRYGSAGIDNGAWPLVMTNTSILV